LIEAVRQDDSDNVGEILSEDLKPLSSRMQYNAHFLEEYADAQNAHYKAIADRT
jgi:hypothetical protein